ncbi:MAG: glycerate kinase [Caulobacterales bacterium 32-69-10]|nr:MAG: glycerate kinase [Caulobacterales bacterium 32-69-10]
MSDPRTFLRGLFDAALAAVDPLACTPPHLPEPPSGRTVVVAFGKGAAAMAKAVEDHWDGPLSGLAVTRYGHGVDCRRIEVIEAAHPVPDAAAVGAAERALALAGTLGPDDLLLALASGGGSSLLTLPAPGLTLADKRAVTSALLRSGAPIGEINTVRRHLSAIKGGRLAQAAAPARVVTLVVSDVPGDDPSQVASGPTVADGSTPADAVDVMARWGINPPAAVVAHLRELAATVPLPKEPPRVIATARMALEAAASAAGGVETQILGDDLEGEARDVGRAHARLALDGPRPRLILSGGETTVTVRGQGRGGRNVEYLLGLALALDGAPGIYALACDTDGIDGTEDNAGAVIGPDTLARARALGLDPAAMLEANDAYSLFGALGDLIVTGPTRTNVNDFRAIWVE